jgi:MoxR-like ATPase
MTDATPVDVLEAADDAESLTHAREVAQRLRARMRAQILGRDDVIDWVIVALLADGHVLLEDYPGSGKTTLAKTLGDSIVDEDPQAMDEIVPFRRIQFTPDLLPSDVTGVSIFDAGAGSFEFRHGPVFASVLLADEINRTSPKVQAALLEAMAEKQVTVENHTYPLGSLFFVIATQNPLDLAGTYPLPVAQLDRFLFKIRMVHIDRESEMEVLETYRERRDAAEDALPRVTRQEVLAARSAVDASVEIAPAVRECLVDLSRGLRDDERVLQGPSTRSMVLALPALQARAVLEGRDFVSGEDVADLAPLVFAHRLELAPGTEAPERILAECLAEPMERLARATLRRP